MTSRPSIASLSRLAAAAAAWLFAGWIAVDTLRTVATLWSPLPWFDEWATVDLIRRWQTGELSAAQVLFAQHNEHRILVPRLVFFADDLLFRGGGHLSFAAIVAVQLLHAGLFAAVLMRGAARGTARWAVAAVVLALMFSLRQAENFSSGFQLQFVAVFAGATLSFLLFGLAVGRLRCGEPAILPLAGSLVAVATTSFTMANGLAAGFVIVVLAVLARLRPAIVMAYAAWALLLTGLYLQDYLPVAHHSRPLDSLTHPGPFLAYVSCYLGGILTTGDIEVASAFGALGLVATLAAALRVWRAGGARPGSLALLGVMLFVLSAAVVTASGRLGLGVMQALSSRYASGSVAFWAAHLVYWWTDPPAWPTVSKGSAAARSAVAILAVALCVALKEEQREAKPQLAVQSFAQNDAADLLMLGLHDPAVIRRVSWGENLDEALSVLRDDHLSIFGTPDFEALGRPVTDRGSPLSPDPCGGEVAAEADAALGQGGVRVAGMGWTGPSRRLLRRILIADARGTVVGYGSGGIPGADRSAWRGFALAEPGAALSAYGVVAGRGLCRIGEARVVAASVKP